MEAHHVLAKHYIRDNTHFLAFSALPGAPVRPEPSRRGPVVALVDLARTVTRAGRPTVAHTHRPAVTPPAA